MMPDAELWERLRKDHGENAIVSVRYFIHNEADGTTDFASSPTTPQFTYVVAP